jgi:hypothetical protein
VPDDSPTPIKLCFVIAPIGAPDTEVRKKSDQVLKHLIRPILEPGYSVERADKMGRPGIITVQVVQQILDADLVIADLTDHNPNVFYELAIRHAAHKPAIHIVSRGQQDVPFDVQDMRFVPYDLADPDSLEEARGKLGDAIVAIERGESVVTPVQIALVLQSLARGEDRDAQVRTLLNSVNTGMSNLQEGIAEIVQDLRQRRVTDYIFGTTLVPSASGFNFPITGFEQVRPAKPDVEPKALAAAAAAIKKTREAKETEGQK